eukprot:comp21435_c0_seq1/m.46446 comp21435_c0_seq1/g.46446  ORF comp21435_c0_seq1/g.46446 comp21435_c0_seq1/m.46446 type:complete len:451 (+) comp21435_c0_seq1:247-1599(+)
MDRVAREHHARHRGFPCIGVRIEQINTRELGLVARVPHRGHKHRIHKRRLRKLEHSNIVLAAVRAHVVAARLPRVHDLAHASKDARVKHGHERRDKILAPRKALRGDRHHGAANRAVVRRKRIVHQCEMRMCRTRGFRQIGLKALSGDVAAQRASTGHRGVGSRGRNFRAMDKPEPREPMQHIQHCSDHRVKVSRLDRLDHKSAACIGSVDRMEEHRTRRVVAEDNAVLRAVGHKEPQSSHSAIECRRARVWVSIGHRHRGCMVDRSRGLWLAKGPRQHCEELGHCECTDGICAEIHLAARNSERSKPRLGDFLHRLSLKRLDDAAEKNVDFAEGIVELRSWLGRHIPCRSGLLVGPSLAQHRPVEQMAQRGRSCAWSCDECRHSGQVGQSHQRCNTRVERCPVRHNVSCAPNAALGKVLDRERCEEHRDECWRRQRLMGAAGGDLCSCR